MKLKATWNGKRVADVEEYLGYTIVLRSFDWDADYKVWGSGSMLRKFPDRTAARGWIDEQRKVVAFA